MKTVYKYRIGVNDRPQQIPGKVIRVAASAPGEQVAVDALFVWSEVPRHVIGEPESVEYGLYQVFGTGHSIMDDAQHIGTVQVESFVWHLYRVGGDDRA